MRRLPLALGGLVLASSALVAYTALSQVPPARTQLITTTHVGKVGLRSTLRLARSQWGAPTKCAGYRCVWSLTKSGTIGDTVSASFQGPGISEIDLTRNARRSARADLSGWRTAKHIGLGSSLVSFRRAYPKAFHYGPTWSINDPNGIVYADSFTFSHGRVQKISLQMPQG